MDPLEFEGGSRETSISLSKEKRRTNPGHRSVRDLSGICGGTLSVAGVICGSGGGDICGCPRTHGDPAGKRRPPESRIPNPDEGSSGLRSCLPTGISHLLWRCRGVATYNLRGRGWKYVSGRGPEIRVDWQDWQGRAGRAPLGSVGRPFARDENQQPSETRKPNCFF